MFSFWTRMSSGTMRRTGAKFQMASIPPSTSRSQTACAWAAGTVMMPMEASSWRHWETISLAGRTGQSEVRKTYRMSVELVRSLMHIFYREFSF